MFNAGDKLILSSHGVATVQRIESKDIGGRPKRFYVLNVDANNMTLLYPIDGNAASGLSIRPISKASELKTALRMARHGEFKVDNTTWNRRYRNYMEKLATGELNAICEVFRCLSILRETKDLSFGERKMRDHAFDLIVNEVVASGALPENEVRDYLLNINE